MMSGLKLAVLFDYWKTRRSILANWSLPNLYFADGCSDIDLDNEEYPQVERRVLLNFNSKLKSLNKIMGRKNLIEFYKY